MTVPELPAPPKPKEPVHPGVQFLTVLLVIAFVLTFVIVAANTLSGS
jgi:hypothetical protein